MDLCLIYLITTAINVINSHCIRRILWIRSTINLVNGSHDVMVRSKRTINEVISLTTWDCINGFTVINDEIVTRSEWDECFTSLLTRIIRGTTSVVI